MINQMTNGTPFFQNSNVELIKKYEQGINFLIFNFKGKFTEAASIEACEAWCRVTRNSPSTSFVVVWKCDDMTGFEQGAKKSWMECLAKNEDQTEDILLISDNILIRGAARLMSKFGSYHLHVFKNESQAAEWLEELASLEIA